MIGSVLTLFKTLIEIILLRKGPNHIPHSMLLLMVVAAIWFLVGIVAVMVIETYKSASLSIDLILAIAGLGFYAILVNSFGHSARLVRGCGPYRWKDISLRAPLIGNGLSVL